MTYLSAIHGKLVHRATLLVLIINILVVGLTNDEVSGQTGINDIPQLTVITSKSIIINIAEPIERVSVTSTEIADAVVISPQQVMINGKKPGMVTLILWDRMGRSTSYDLVVQVDTSLLQSHLEKQFPTETINVTSANDAVVLSGNVSEPAVVEKSIEIAGAFATKVINLLQLPPPPDTEQIMLQVRFADVDRSASQALGANIISTGALNTLGSTSTQQFGQGLTGIKLSTISPGLGPAFEAVQTLTDVLNIFFFRFDLNLGATIKALQQKNLLQILAEPNLIASNGKEASFLAGGEFPVPIVQGGAINTVTTVFKEFGIRLRFTPTITQSGKIRLKLKSEVSALDFSNATTLGGFFIPALSTRRTETEIELADGQSFAISGLIDNRVTETYSKVPGIGDIPILGYFFKSRQLKKSKAELLVMVTPKFVKPLNPDQNPNFPRNPKPFLDSQRFDGKIGHTDNPVAELGEPTDKGPVLPRVRD